MSISFSSPNEWNVLKFSISWVELQSWHVKTFNVVGMWHNSKLLAYFCIFFRFWIYLEKKIWKKVSILIIFLSLHCNIEIYVKINNKNTVHNFLTKTKKILSKIINLHSKNLWFLFSMMLINNFYNDKVKILKILLDLIAQELNWQSIR